MNTYRQKRNTLNMQSTNNSQALQKRVYNKPSTTMKTKPQGKGIVKALGQKGTTGNFKKIQKSQGIAAAIGALQNKLAKRRGLPIPYTGKKK